MQRLRSMLAVAALVLAAAGPAAADPGAALRAAATAGNAAEVARLLAAGAPVDAADGSKQTALLLAVAGGHDDTARALIDAGASINAQAANQDTPWLLAGARGRAKMLEMMLPKGPDLSIRNRFGGNALIPACERGHLEAVRVLLKTKIPIDHVNNLGWTCLLEIVILGSDGPRHVEVTKLVLAAGANPNIADREGVSPLAHARKQKFTNIAQLIEAAGGK